MPSRLRQAASRAAWRLRGLGQLRTPREAILLARLSAFAALVPLALRLPLPRVSRWLVAPLRQRHASPAEIERLERLVALAPRVAGPVVRAGCLTRGVTLFWFLRRAGLDVELRFGVDPADPGAPDGHCWLALHGEPFLEAVDPRSRFTETYRLPAITG